jgi:hypothetical protein
MATDEHSTSYELGFMFGERDCKELPLMKRDQIESMAIATWTQARKSMQLELVDFVNAYRDAYVMWYNGFI